MNRVGKLGSAKAPGKKRQVILPSGAAAVHAGSPSRAAGVRS
jgi:hypothetical protein